MPPERKEQTAKTGGERPRNASTAIQRDTTAQPHSRKLQERLGNQGAQTFATNLAPNATKGGRRQTMQAVDLPPIMIGATKESSNRMQKIADSLWERFPSIARGFLIEWFAETSAAVNSIQGPPDPDASMYWWIALAGNITWAATSLLAPELNAAITLMSFGGAAVGSGALQALYGVSKPDGKSALIQRLAEARDKMEMTAGPVIEDALAEAAAKNITNPTAQDKLLWKRMFPGISFESRSGTIFKAALAEAMSALDDFAKQYADWQNTIRNLVDDERIKNYRSVGDYGEAGARAGYYLRPVSKAEHDRAASKHPFHPRLKFKGLAE